MTAIAQIIAAAPASAVAYKHADPTEDARYLFDRSEAESIAREDPSLIVWLGLTQADLDDVGAYLPDDRREVVASALAPCTPAEWVRGYEERYGRDELLEAARLGLSHDLVPVLEAMLPPSNLDAIRSELTRLTGGHVAAQWADRRAPGAAVEIGDEQGGGTYDLDGALLALRALSSADDEGRDSLWTALESARLD